MKNIASKMVKVMEACSYVQKDKTNSFHKYTYASAEAILEKINAALVANGLATIPKSRVISEREKINAKGATETIATVEMTITIVDSESGETMEFVGLGSGQDSGDKAIMKAQTAAQKYAWITGLQMATGDDPEEDAGPDQRNTPASIYLINDIKQMGRNQGKEVWNQVFLTDIGTGESIEGWVIPKDVPEFNFKPKDKITASFGGQKVGNQLIKVITKFAKTA